MLVFRGLRFDSQSKRKSDVIMARKKYKWRPEQVKLLQWVIVGGAFVFCLFLLVWRFCF